MDNLQRYLQMAMDWAVVFVPKVALAFLILWVGLRVITKLNSITTKTLTTRNIDATIRPFFASMVDVSLRFILFLIVAGIFGFEISSIVALIGALAFAVGLALQGSLGHFASGILLLILKPYKVGDEIKVGDAEGFVEEIQVFNTILKTRDNRMITVPNGLITSGNIINYSGLGIRRADMVFIVDEPNRVSDVKNAILKAAKGCTQILPEPPMEVFLEHFNCDELHFAVRPWCKAEDYWTVWGYMQEAVKDSFDDADLTGNINYIQMIHDRNELNEARRNN
ncbi:MAG: mechanosensitive ion channel [Saprospiraceae bacterium]|nr:mechanosensitive ion channel [Saprospiraceae bacterium]